MMINLLACPYPDLAPVFSLVRYVVSLAAVIVPIVLIVLGIIDFSKAVMAKDEGEIKKNQSIFIKRVIYGVAIFFVYTIVVFVMNMLGDYFSGDVDSKSWIDCFNNTPLTESEKAEAACDEYSGLVKEECVSCYLNNKLWRGGKCDNSVSPY